MKSVPERPTIDYAAVDEKAHRLVAEGKATHLADAYLAQIDDDEHDALLQALARLLISVAKNGGKPRRVVPLPSVKR